MHVTRDMAKYLADLLEAHWGLSDEGAECLCKELRDIPEVKAVLIERATHRPTLSQDMN